MAFKFRNFMDDSEQSAFLNQEGLEVSALLCECNQLCVNMEVLGKALKCLFISDSCTDLPDEHFMNCSSLTRVTFSIWSKLKRVGNEAFMGCTSLREIEIPASVEEIGERCFYDCSSLSRVMFASGSGVKRIGKVAFCGCRSLREIEIPSSVEKIGEGIFQECNVGKVSVCDGSAFFRVLGPFVITKEMQLVCTFRTSDKIEIPSNIQEIGEGCFRPEESHGNYSGSAVRDVTFASGSFLRCIRKNAFYWCGRLREIEIPASVEYIGERCFSHCNSLLHVTFAKGSVLKRIESSAFRKCKLLWQIEIPASVEEIGERCFYRCYDLSHITFASGSVLKRIGKEAFSHCNIGKIEIPASVEEIGEHCFWYCYLSCVTFASRSSMMRIGKEAFMRYKRKPRYYQVPVGVNEITYMCME